MSHRALIAMSGGVDSSVAAHFITLQMPDHMEPHPILKMRFLLHNLLHMIFSRDAHSQVPGAFQHFYGLRLGYRQECNIFRISSGAKGRPLNLLLYLRKMT